MMNAHILLINVKLEEKKKAKSRELQNQSIKKRNLLQGLYFDGRKNNILVIENLNQKYFRRIIQKERYSIIQKP